MVFHCIGTYTLCVHSLVDEYIGCLQFLDITNKTATNIYVKRHITSLLSHSMKQVGGPCRFKVKGSKFRRRGMQNRDRRNG